MLAVVSYVFASENQPPVFVSIFGGSLPSNSSNPYNNNEVHTFILSKGLASINVPYSVNLNYTKQYLSYMNNFSDVNFQSINAVSTVMSSRNVNDKIRGYKISDKNYAIHLLGCDSSDISCAFRINGVPTRKLRPGDIFPLNDGNILKINSIVLDYCNNQRFCDVIYDAYDLINYSIVKEGLNE